MGALSDRAIRAEDIAAGLYDGAQVRCWQVNWADPGQRQALFAGSLGEIRQTGGAFRAELRGLTEALNTPLGRVFQKTCDAVLGDPACAFDLSSPGCCVQTEMRAGDGRARIETAPLDGVAPGWFAHGRLQVLDGPGAGLWSAIRQDRALPGGRSLDLWAPLARAIAPGAGLKLVVGCDKKFRTCREKFNNISNFRGFPDLPSEDWAMAVPRSGQAHAGGSRR